ncbi:MAG: YihY family inner membrane protein [Verrucomicrobia bacterium]|nr:YihY family inner membrane protein [Verrucomicrobiota bacterium]
MSWRVFERGRQLARETLATLRGDYGWEADRGRQTWAGRGWHFILVVLHHFDQNRCLVRATALAYTTLLALIPLLAVAMAIYTSFLKKEGEKPVQEVIDRLIFYVAPQLDLVSSAELGAEADPAHAPSAAVAAPDGIGTNISSPAQREEGVGRSAGPAASLSTGRQDVVRRITEYIGNVQSGTLGLTGFISLVLVGILLLSNVEQTFNDIWGVATGRSWPARVAYYWAAITLGPLVLLGALGLTSSSVFAATRTLFFSTAAGKWLFSLGLPWLLLSMGFTLLYLLMPNTQVDWRAALVGGAICGVLWQLNNLFSLTYVSRVIGYSKIYGSLTSIPLLLMGLYMSWLILLLGAQVAYTFQNRQIDLQEKRARRITPAVREQIGLHLMAVIGRRFEQGLPAATLPVLAETLNAPLQLLSQLIQVLRATNLLHATDDAVTGFVPSRPLAQITVQSILEAIRAGGLTPSSQPADIRDPDVAAALLKVRQAESDAARQITLIDLAQPRADRSPLSHS